MDADRFDALAKSLTAHPSRRAALRLLAGSALAAGLARLGLAEAKKGRRRKRRKKAPSCGSAGAPCCKGGKCTAAHTFCLAGTCMCALTSLPRACGGRCIAARDCCVDNRPLREGHTHRDCGVCTAGELAPSTALCGPASTVACRACNEETFFCRPANEGQPCPPGAAGDARCCDGDCCPAAECCPDGCCPGGEICCRGLECCPLERCCGDGCCAADEECCGAPGRCLPACPAGQARDPQTCRCGCPIPRAGRGQAAEASRGDGRPPDRRAVQGQGFGGPCYGIPPCPWPGTAQECCDEYNGYVCTPTKVCCKPDQEPCGGAPGNWGCCCDTAAGEVCNPDFDNTQGSECCPCRDGGVRCWDKCCQPGETCDFATLRCVPSCPVA